MGDLFDAGFYQRSIDSFQFLLREYPAGKYREDALLAVAHIEQDDLHDSVQAQEDLRTVGAAPALPVHAAEVRASLDVAECPERLGQGGAACPASPSPVAKEHSGSECRKDHFRGKNSISHGHQAWIARWKF